MTTCVVSKRASGLRPEGRPASLFFVPEMRPIPSCTTSWDDGHPLDHRVAALLAKYGLTGTFYVPIQNAREVMTAQQIRELSGSFEIGAHTAHHVVLTEVSAETAEGEIHDSKRRLEDITGRICEGFCFPRGRFHPGHLHMVRRSGLRYARTVELLSTRLPARRSGIYLIPTTVQVCPHRWTIYARNGAKRLALLNLKNLILHARSHDWPETARSMLRVVARQGGVFHLWGHSWEIEKRRQWAELEAVLREMRELRSLVPCLPNASLVRPEGVDGSRRAAGTCAL